MGKIPKTLLPEVEDIFNTYPWYGNVRELRNVIERAVIFCRGNTVDKDLLPPEMLDFKYHDAPAPKSRKYESKNNSTSNHHQKKNNIPIDTVLLEVEKQMIDDALKQTKGNKTLAAGLLDISRYSLTRRIKKIEKANKLQKQDKSKN
jgi:DNA-binding NtrC family response regulator